MEIKEKMGFSEVLTEVISFAYDIGTLPYGYIDKSFLEKCTAEEFLHELGGAYILLRMLQK